MAEVEVHVAGRNYRIACRDGEEPKLRDVAALVDSRAQSAVAALGPMGEARQLLFAALMLADGQLDAPPGPPEDDDARVQSAVADAMAETVEGLAERLEAFAADLEARRLEGSGPTP